MGDGRQLAAALALGADGVNLGTRFCVTKESNWPQSFKEAAVRESGRVVDAFCAALAWLNIPRVW